MPCSYCDVGGHTRDECPHRQEIEIGVSGHDYDDPLKQCPSCGRAVNLSVNDRCWNSECDHDFTEDDREIVTDGGTLRNPDRPNWTPVSDGEDDAHCRNCGSHVLTRTPKVFGDENDILWHCTHCVSIRDLKFGAGTMPDYDPTRDRGRSSDNMPIFPGTGGDES